MAKSLFAEWRRERREPQVFRPAGQTVTPISLRLAIRAASEKEVSPTFSASQPRIGLDAYNRAVQKRTACENPLAVALSGKGSVSPRSPSRMIAGGHVQVLAQALTKVAVFLCSAPLLRGIRRCAD